MTSILIDNVFSKEDGEIKVAKLKEITKWNFHQYEYLICPIGGSFDIRVSTDYEFRNYETGRVMTEYEAEKELLQDFIMILANQI